MTSILGLAFTSSSYILPNGGPPVPPSGEILQTLSLTLVTASLILIRPPLMACCSAILFGLLPVVMTTAILLHRVKLPNGPSARLLQTKLT